MKKNNKGFSLVELIIVIAIMAILAGAIAPALIRYIDKSRKSNDVSSAKTIKTAVETALGNESIYEYLATNGATILFNPGDATTSGGVTFSKGISITSKNTATSINGKNTTQLKETATSEIATNIGEKIPKLKYRKKIGSAEPKYFEAYISDKGTVYVFITTGNITTFTEDTDVGAKADGAYQIAPYICDDYQ